MPPCHPGHVAHKSLCRRQNCLQKSGKTEGADYWFTFNRHYQTNSREYLVDIREGDWGDHGPWKEGLGEHLIEEVVALLEKGDLGNLTSASVREQSKNGDIMCSSETENPKQWMEMTGWIDSLVWPSDWQPPPRITDPTNSQPTQSRPTLCLQPARPCLAPLAKRRKQRLVSRSRWDFVLSCTFQVVACFWNL